MRVLRITVAAAASAAIAVTVPAGAWAGDASGRMMADGWLAVEDPNIRVGVRGELQCGVDGSQSQVLEIAHGDQKFELRELTAADCAVEDPNLRGGEHVGAGTGVCGGAEAEATWRLIDNPNIRDTVEFDVRGDGCAFTVADALRGGDLQFIDDPNI